MKIAYFYDCDTFEYIGNVGVHLEVGYDEYLLPQLSTFAKPPEFDSELEQIKFDESTGAWVVELKLIKVTAYSKDDRSSSEFDDITNVPDTHTAIKPVTEFDKWSGDKWVTDLDTKFEVECERVRNTRRYEYSVRTDPLRFDQMSAIDDGDTVLSEALKVQIAEIKEKIRSDHPFPTR